MDKSSVVKARLSFKGSEHREALLNAAKQAAFALLGLMFARAKIFNGISPFGVAFAAAAPGGVGVAAAIGSAAGYLLGSSGTMSVRYIACVAGVMLVRLLALRFGPAAKSRVLVPVCAGLCCASTAAAVLLAQGFAADTALAFLCDCLLAGTLSYFFSLTLSLVEKPEKLSISGRRGIICLTVSACAVLMSFSDIEFLNFRPAEVVGAFIILLCAYLLRESGGAFAGICAGAALGAAAGYIPLAGLFAFGGLLSGLFYPFGPLGMAAALLAACGLNAVIAPSPQAVAIIAESAAAALIFVLLPRSRLDSLRSRISARELPCRTRESEDLRGRLESARTALSDVADCVNSVSQGLEKIGNDDPVLLCARVKQSVCASCPNSPVCADKNSALREDAFSAASAVLREDGHVSPGDFPREFQKICTRRSRLAENFNRVFLDNAACVAVNGRVRQLRQVVADQFASMADILGEISADMCRSDTLLEAEQATATEILAAQGLEVSAALCLRDADGVARLRVSAKSVPEKLDFAKTVSALRRGLGINLSFPSVTNEGEGVSMEFEEKPRYRFELGAVQRCSGESKLCGDYFQCFASPGGREMIVISDGMGTGGRAAVDAAMASSLFSTLIKAGLSCEAALKIVNSALLSKSEEETLATLDIAALDPYSGNVEFFKAGGAPCFVRKGKKTAVLEQPSMPAGILRDIRFSTAQATLDGGDILLMASDGVMVDDGGFIKTALSEWRGGAQELAESIAAAAVRRRGGARADDITVVCAMARER